MKISALPTLTTPALNDEIALSDVSASSATKRATLATVLALVYPFLYPVGSIYTNATDSTNPGTLLGFGTWVVFGAGKVPVGIDSSDSDFNTAGNTIGEKAHTLTVGELANHAHGVYDPGHSHSTQGTYVRDVGAGGNLNGTSGGSVWRNLSNVVVNGSGTGIGIYAEGGNQAHNNIQPSIVVYMWRRTA